MSDLNIQLMLSILQGGANDVSDLLIQGADAKAITPFGDPVIISALQFGSLAMVKLLLDNGADKTVVGIYGENAVQYAFSHGLHDALELLEGYGESNEAVLTKIFEKSVDPTENSLLAMMKFLSNDVATAEKKSADGSVSNIAVLEDFAKNVEHMANEYSKFKGDHQKPSSAPLNMDAKENIKLTNNQERVVDKNIKNNSLKPVSGGEKNDALKSVNNSKNFKKKLIKIDAVKQPSNDEKKIIDLKDSIELQRNAIKKIESEINRFENLSIKSGDKKYDAKIKELTSSFSSKWEALESMKNDLLNLEDDLQGNHDSNALNPQSEAESKHAFDLDELVGLLNGSGQSIQAEGVTNSNCSPTSTEEDYSVQPADEIGLNMTQNPLL